MSKSKVEFCLAKGCALKYIIHKNMLVQNDQNTLVYICILDTLLKSSFLDLCFSLLSIYLSLSLSLLHLLLHPLLSSRQFTVISRFETM